MSEEHFQRSINLSVSAAEAFAWHERQGAFARLNPPWEKVAIRHADGGIRDGGTVELVSRLGPLRLVWKVRHHGYAPGRLFCDEQVRGPFAVWEHRHEFVPDPTDANRSTLVDAIRYRLPGGPFAGLGRGFVARKLERLFAYRHRVMADDLAVRARHPIAPMTILVTGASGLVGRALVPFLQTQGHTIVRAVRRGAIGPDEVSWDPAAGEMDLSAIGSLDAVIHLAGENIAGGLWTEQRRARILRSRIEGTRTLVKAMKRLATPPRVLICASAVGYYGSSAAVGPVDEKGGLGSGFLAEVCAAWETEAHRAESAGTRVVLMRTGVVLTPEGGALAKMLPAFKMGLGGPLGSGQQPFAWITPDDLVGAYYHVLLHDALSGPVNAVAPELVDQATFSRVLGEQLHRPTRLRVPSVVLTTLLGDLAKEALLGGTTVLPAALTHTGYAFRYGRLASGLAHVLGKCL